MMSKCQFVTGEKLTQTQAYAWLTSTAIIRSLNKVKAQIIKVPATRMPKDTPILMGGWRTTQSLKAKGA